VSTTNDTILTANSQILKNKIKITKDQSLHQILVDVSWYQKSLNPKLV
jgi:hypothetical protein